MTVAAVVMSTTQAQMKRKNRKNKKEMQQAEEARANAEAAAKLEEASKPPLTGFAKFGKRLLDVLNSLTLQTCLYFAFVLIFQGLAGAMRLKQEVRERARMRSVAMRATAAALSGDGSRPLRARLRPMRQQQQQQRLQQQQQSSNSNNQ